MHMTQRQAMSAMARRTLAGLALLVAAHGPTAAVTGFALGPRFTLDTRTGSTEPGYATGPDFELSALRIAGRVVAASSGAAVAGATVLDIFET